MTARAMQHPPEESRVSPAQVKFAEYQRARDSGDKGLADKLWMEYLRAVDAEMRRRAK